MNKEERICNRRNPDFLRSCADRKLTKAIEEADELIQSGETDDEE